MAVKVNGMKQKKQHQQKKQQKQQFVPQQLLQQQKHPNGLLNHRGSTTLKSLLHRLVSGLVELRQRVVSSLAIPKFLTELSPPGEWWTNLDVTGRLEVVDGILSCSVWTPLVVLFWWGAWGVLDTTLLQWMGVACGSTLMLTLSVIIQVTAGYCQRSLNAYIRSLGSVKRNVASRLYSLVLGWAAVSHYRGLSALWGTFRSPGLTPSLRLVATTAVMLTGLGRSADVLEPPLSIILDPDTPDFTYSPSLLYIQPNGCVASLLDHVATVSFLGTLVHLHWLAVWDVVDELQYSCSPFVSIMTSWTIGYFIVVAFMVNQEKIRVLFNGWCTPASKLFKDMLCNVFILIANLGCVLVWQGFWVLFDLLGEHFPIYQDTNDVTPAYTNWAAFCLLVVAHISSSLVHKTSYPEEQEGETSDLWFDFQYFGKFLTEEVEDEDEDDDDDKDDVLSVAGSRSVSSRSSISGSESSLNELSKCTGVYWDIYRYHDEDSSNEDLSEETLTGNKARGKDRWATCY